MYETQAPYLAVYAIITDEEGRIPFVLRENTSWKNDHYSLAAGKVEQRESCTQAVVREAKEELGVDVHSDDVEHALTVHRSRADDESSEWLDVFFAIHKYKGEVHNAEPHMHAQVDWFHPDDLPVKITPPVRAALHAIEQGQTYIEVSWDD